INIAQIANANISSLGNWNQAPTAATATGIPAVGADGTPVPGTAEIDVSAFAVTAADDGFDTFDINVNGTTVTVAAVAGTNDAAAARATLATNIATAINGAGVDDLTVSATGTTVSLSNAGAS